MGISRRRFTCIDRYVSATAGPYAKVCRDRHIPRRDPLVIYIDIVIGCLFVWLSLLPVPTPPSTQPNDAATHLRRVAQVPRRDQDAPCDPPGLGQQARGAAQPPRARAGGQQPLGGPNLCSSPRLPEALPSLRVRPGGRRGEDRVCVRACVRACVRVYARMCIDMYVYTCTYIYICMHAYIHVYMRVYVDVCVCTRCSTWRTTRR